MCEMVPLLVMDMSADNLQCFPAEYSGLAIKHSLLLIASSEYFPDDPHEGLLEWSLEPATQ